MALNIAEYCREKGYEASLAAAWRARGIDRFTPLQQQALERGVDDSFDAAALIAAPPGAGKSLIAELRAAAHLTRGERVLWFVPTRALARLQGEALRATFAAQGWNVHIADEDENGAASGHAAQERDGLPANFDLTVAVYEKGLQWLVRRPHDLADAGLVVIDELTMLRDAERGATLATLIALLRASPYAPRRVGLCAPVADAARLAAWWGGALLESRQRPGPLREGVATLAANGDCLFRWRERAGEGEGEETLATGEALRAIVNDAEMPFDGNGGGGRSSESLLPTLALAAELARRGEATLLFAPTRSQAREWARRLAGVALGAQPNLAHAGREAARLARAEPCHDHALLETLLAAGVGMHHADLTPAARRLVEAAFAAGHLRLLVATPTLAQGVNLPVKNVLHWPQMLQPQAGGGWSERPLEYWRYLDQAGRAGRLHGQMTDAGVEAKGGRSIILALRPRQAARYWRQYVLGEAEPLRAAPTIAEKELFTLRALAGDVARTPENLKTMLDLAWGFAKTKHGASETEHRPRYSQGLRGIIRRAQAAGLVRAGSRVAPLRLTPLGQICARHGIALETLARLRIALESMQSTSSHAAEPLAMLALLALAAPPGLWPRRRAEAARGALDWEAWFEAQGLIFPPPLREHLSGANFQGLDSISLSAAERLVLWISPQPTAEIEMESGWTAGMLARAGEGLAWLARAAAAVGLALEPEKRITLATASTLRAFARRLPAGLTAKALPLAKLMDAVAGLGRTAVQSLAREGWGSLEALAEATPASISAMAMLLGDPALADTVVENARRLLAFAEQKESKSGQEPGLKSFAPQPKTMFQAKTMAPDPLPKKIQTPPEPATTEPAPPARAMLPLLALDLQSPGIVRVAGQELCLPPLLFDLLAALAECPGRVLARGAIYHRLWPDGGPEEQQIDAHRRRLNAALRPALEAPAPDLVQMVRGMGLRLNIEESRVHMRRG